MNELKYKINAIEGETLEGSTNKIIVKEKNNAFTILKDHSPTIAVLEKGQIIISKSETDSQSISFEHAILSVQDNMCYVCINL